MNFKIFWQQNKFGILTIVFGIVLFNLCNIMRMNIREAAAKEISYQELVQKVENNDISKIDINDKYIFSYEKTIRKKTSTPSVAIAINENANALDSYLTTYSNGTNIIIANYKTLNNMDNIDLAELLKERPHIAIIQTDGSYILWFLAIYTICIIGIYYINQKSKSKAIVNSAGGKLSTGKENDRITFKDVAGEDEAKESLEELVDFLHNPDKYTKIGAKLPKGALMVGPPGSGKACWDEEQIITPDGLKKIKNIKLGDFIYGKNGKKTQVIGVYPQGKKKLYKIILADNRSLICSGDHRFIVGHKYHNKEIYEILTINDLLEKGIKEIGNNRCKFFIQNNDLIEFDYKNLPIHPYLLGVFLGDGCVSDGKLLLSSQTSEIPNKIAELLTKQLKQPIIAKNSLLNYNWVFYYKNKIYGNNKNKLVHAKDIVNDNKLIELLTSSYSYDKYIPDDYKYCSYQQRLELIQGLMDTDGSINKKDKKRYNIRYSTSSKKLLIDVCEVLRSLGNIYVSNKTIDKRNEKYNFVINIGCSNKFKMNLFSLLSKVKIAKEATRIINKSRYRHYNRLNIIDIQDINLIDDCTCFTVDAKDHQFIAGETVVTHNTLLAKAVAGEAKVPFLYKSASEFVEMYVGVGASRVRDLFNEAKRNAPCIVFIDEIDAIGGVRGQYTGGTGGGDSERDQTLNQLLTEMDGFQANKGIIVIGATNRPEMLDKALLRPGRFDRRIVVERPDLKGRIEILKVHCKNVKLDKTVDLDELGLATSGLVGADLANIVNEAAINAIKQKKDKVSQNDLKQAIELVMVGKEKKDRILSENEKKTVAYHESGHATVGKILTGRTTIKKISIIPVTNGALGYVLSNPSEEQYLQTKEEMLNEVKMLLAGRATEELIFGSDKITNGASNDLEKATNILKSMFTLYGMGKNGGLYQTYKQTSQYLSNGSSVNCSPEMAYKIDEEIKEYFNKCYKETKKIILKNKKLLEETAQLLLKQEIITGEEFDKIFEKVKNEEEKAKTKNKK